MVKIENFNPLRTFHTQYPRANEQIQMKQTSHRPIRKSNQCKND